MAVSANDLAVLAISGYNMRALIALCRYCRCRAIPLHLVAKSKTDPIYLTSYRTAVLFDRQASALVAAEFCAWLRELRDRFGYRRVLIAPSSEFFNRFLLANRDAIEASGGIIPLVAEDLYAAISDKYAFSEMCRGAGIGVPKQFEAPPEAYPFVAKPLSYASASNCQLKPYLIFGDDDRREFAASELAADFYYQEFIEGPSFYLLTYVSRSGEVVKYSQQNLIQQARGGSIILASRSDFHLSAESEKYLALLRDKAFFGLVMIEVRLNRRTGEFAMIEANPRMWGPIQFVLDNDVDLFGALFSDFGVPQATPNRWPARFAAYYFWSGGLSAADRPFAFHDYAPDDFVNDYKEIARCDLYRRDDTLALYENELTT